MIEVDEKHRILRNKIYIGAIVYDEQGFRYAPAVGVILDSQTLNAIELELLRAAYHGFVKD